MVILRGYVRDGKLSNEYEDVVISGAAVIQGVRVTYTSSDGSFYTSADTTMNYATCEATEYKTVNYSIPVFATRYDPSGVISGTITRPIDTTTTPGHTYIWDGTKEYIPGTLINRVLEMRYGTDDGKSAIIVGNTVHQIELDGSGGTSGGWTWC